MEAYEVIKRLTSQGVKLSVREDKLSVKANPEVMTPELRQLIGENKHSIIEILQSGERALDIEKAPPKEYYVLSSAQKRIYFLQQVNQRATTYNMPWAVKLTGSFDKLRLEAALTKLVQRHENLRTTFAEVDDEPMQQVSENINFELVCTQATSAEIPILLRDFIRPFDLEHGPLMRAGLVELIDEDTRGKNYVLMMDVHHIVSDGISQNLLNRDLIALYGGEELPALRLHYKDYAEWQQGEHKSSSLQKQKQFWLREFQEEFTPINLPADFPRPQERNYLGETVTLLLPAEQTMALKKLAESNGVTMFALLLSVLKVWLHKLSGQKDLVVGTTVTGREHADLESVMGMFVNTLPVRLSLEGDLSFDHFARKVQDKLLSCFDHQSYPYENLVDDLNLQRDISRNPLFDIVFNYLDFEKSNQQTTGIEGLSTGHNRAKFDLSIAAMESDSEIKLDFQYATEIFNSATMQRFASYFEAVVDQVLSNVSVAIGEISVLTAAETRELLQDFLPVEAPHTLEHTITDLFARQVAATPNAEAISAMGEHLSYAELNEAANRLAHKLLRQGVGEQTVIGLMFDRSPEMIISLLAVLKAGCVYLPMSPAAPEERLRYMLEDSEATLLLVQHQAYQQDYGVPTLVYEQLSLTGSPNSNPPTESILGPASLAYIIYTSGTTGKPKGTPILHRGVSGLVIEPNYIQFQSTDRILQLSN